MAWNPLFALVEEISTLPIAWLYHTTWLSSNSVLFAQIVDIFASLTIADLVTLFICAATAGIVFCQFQHYQRRVQALRADADRLAITMTQLQDKMTEAAKQWRHTPKAMKNDSLVLNTSPEYLDTVLAASRYRRLGERLASEIDGYNSRLGEMSHHLWTPNYYLFYGLAALGLLRAEPAIVLHPPDNHVGRGVLRWDRNHVQGMFEKYLHSLDLLEDIKVPLDMRIKIYRDIVRKSGIPLLGSGDTDSDDGKSD